MQVILALDELTLFLESLDDQLVGILDEDTLVILDLGSKLAFVIDGTDYGNTGSLEDIVVILTETGSCMDDSASVLSCDIVAEDGHEGTLVVQVREIVEQRVISHSLELGTLVLLEDLVGGLVFVVGTESCLAKDVLVSAFIVQYLHVVDIRT